MKIITFLFDPNVGGPTVRVGLVFPALLESGLDVRVAMPDSKGTAKKYLSDKLIPVDSLKFTKPVFPNRPVAFCKFILTAPVGLIRLVKYLREQQANVVHINGAYDVLPAFAAKISGCKIMWHLNDMLFSPKVSRVLGKFIYHFSSRVVVSSRAVAIHYGIDATDEATIYPPVNCSFYSGTEYLQARIGRLSEGVPRLGIVGNWNWIKGHEHFISTVRLLADDAGQKPVGVIAGRLLETQRNYWEPLLQEIEECKDDLSFEVHDFVDDIAAFLNEIDFLIITSHSEAGPMVALEAMASGIPVVGFDVGALHEFLDDKTNDYQVRLVCKQGDVKCIANAVKGMSNNHKLYEDVASMMVMLARSRFDLAHSVKAHVDNYRKCMD